LRKIKGDCLLRVNHLFPSCDPDGYRPYTDYQLVTAHFDTFWSVYQKSMDLSALSLLATVISLNQVVLAGHPYTPYLLIN
jgi:hypothetical protein